MDTRLWDKVDPVSCQLRKLVGHMQKTGAIHRLLETLRDAAGQQTDSTDDVRRVGMK